MKATLLFLFLLFLLKHKVTYASISTPQASTENDVYLQGFTLESSKVNTIFACYTKCEDNILCTSINMNLTDKTCELKNSTKTRHPEKIVERQNMIYMKIRDPIGLTSDYPIPSCKWLKDFDCQAKSGVYWMKFNDSSSTPFQVFCEMTIDGGGWTLVYSYNLTRYDNLRAPNSTITPVPNWPLSMPVDDWAPISTVTPLSESSYSAMEFALWKKIGNEFLIKSNITNWVACVEGDGSFLKWVPGTLVCRVVKAITSTCTTIAPDRFKVWGCGIALKNDANTGSYQFVLDGKYSTCFPTHDSCATNSAGNYLKNVPHPGSAKPAGFLEYLIKYILQLLTHRVTPVVNNSK